MNLLGFLQRRASAPVARERLQILLAHERTTRGRPDLLAALREEILAVVARHIPLEGDMVHVSANRGVEVSTLAIDIEIPNSMHARAMLPS